MPSPAGAPDPDWREGYFTTPRPRCDGIYVGECGYKRWVRAGHHADLRKNAEALAVKGGRGSEWVSYRRYVRLLPPEPETGTQWALVLQDACPREAAERELILGVDPEAHTNPARPEGVLSQAAVTGPSGAEQLRRRICLGNYRFDPEKQEVDIRYAAADGDFHLVFSLSSDGPHGFADRLAWEHYAMEDESSEMLTFNLGRLPEWKGGGLADENKDHFAQKTFMPKLALEHLC